MYYLCAQLFAKCTYSQTAQWSSKWSKQLEFSGCGQLSYIITSFVMGQKWTSCKNTCWGQKRYNGVQERVHVTRIMIEIKEMG